MCMCGTQQSESIRTLDCTLLAHCHYVHAETLYNDYQVLTSLFEGVYINVKYDAGTVRIFSHAGRSPSLNKTEVFQLILDGVL